MTKGERELLLTVARILRTHIKDHARNTLSKFDLELDLESLNEALRHFDPSDTESANERPVRDGGG